MKRLSTVSAVAASVLLVGAGVATAQEPSASPSDEATPDSGGTWDSGGVRFESDSFELRVGDKAFQGAGPAEVSGDPGGPDYRTLEVIWHEQGVEQRMNLYFAADESDWWITEVRTYDGHEEGEWINYLQVGEMWGEMLRTPRGSTYEGDVQFVGWGRVPGELLIEGLELTAFAPGTGPAPLTDCEFAVSAKKAEKVRPTEKGQPLHKSGYKKMTPVDIEAMLQDLGLCFEFRYEYNTGPWIDGGQEGYSERWCTAPPSGRVGTAFYGSDGEIIVVVEDDEIREPREQPLAGWNCSANE